MDAPSVSYVQRTALSRGERTLPDLAVMGITSSRAPLKTTTTLSEPDSAGPWTRLAAGLGPRSERSLRHDRDIVEPTPSRPVCVVGETVGARLHGRTAVDEKTVTVGSQEIAYLQSAGTERTVLLVHGNSSSSRTWRALMAGPFGQRFRCLALDLPGHGRSVPAVDHSTYSLPGYAATLAGFAEALAAQDAVVVGWSLGGHIVIEAAPALPRAAGFFVFGAPPVSVPAQMAEAFLPNPVMNTGFSADVSPEEALAYAGSFVAPGSGLALDEFVADILHTDGAARAGLAASIGEGRFADELAIAGALRQPLAIAQGENEQLVNLDYLQQLSIPALWRGAVQIVAAAGHAPQEEATQDFASLLDQFIADLG